MLQVKVVKFQPQNLDAPVSPEALEIASSIWIHLIKPNIDAIAYSIQELDCVIHEWSGLPDHLEISEQPSREELLAITQMI